AVTLPSSNIVTNVNIVSSNTGTQPGLSLVTDSSNPFTEPTSGTAPFNFHFHLTSGTLATPLTVLYRTDPGTAVSPSDYTGVNTFVTIPAGTYPTGVDSAMVSITIQGKVSGDQPTESFSIRITGTSGGNDNKGI